MPLVLKMEVGRQPDHRHGKRDHKDDEDDATFAPLFSQRGSRATGVRVVPPTRVMEGGGNVETAAALGSAAEQFLALATRSFLRHPRRLRDHALELLHLLSHLRGATGQFFLFVIERRLRFRRAAAHAELLPFRREPEENNERDESENDQRQRDRETDLHPLRESFSAMGSAEFGGRRR